jgi:hypothetical protein
MSAAGGGLRRAARPHPRVARLSACGGMGIGSALGRGHGNGGFMP